MVAKDGIQTTFGNSLVIYLKLTQRQVRDLSKTNKYILLCILS